MFRDRDSGEWNMTRREEAWIGERAKELAGEAFDNLDDRAKGLLIDIFFGEASSNATQATKEIVQAAIRYSAWPRAEQKEVLDAAVRRLRDEFIDRECDHYEGAAADELQESVIAARADAAAERVA